MFGRKPRMEPDAALDRAFELLDQQVHPREVLRFLEKNKVPTDMVAAACAARGTTAAAAFGLDVPEPQAGPPIAEVPAEEPGFFLADEPGEQWTPALIGRYWAQLAANAREAGISPGVTEWSPTYQCWVIRPQQVTKLQLAAGVKLTQGEAVAALRPDEELLDFQPLAHPPFAAFGQLAPVERQCRQVLAGMLGCRPWELGVQVCLSQPGSDHPVEWVLVSGAPLVTMERNRMAKVLESSLEHLPGGSDGWRAQWAESLGMALLSYGKKATLPTSVPADFATLLDPQRQWVLPYGVDERGTTVAWDVTAEPMALLVGRTGTGKTITLYSIASSAIARGWDLALCEVSKSLGDFDELRPYVVPGGWGATKHDASLVIRNLYALKDERMRAINAAGHKKLHSMTRAEQEAAGLRPILLIIDEAAALLAVPPNVKGLPKDHPVALQIQEEQLDVALAGDAIRRMSAELRAVGIHLMVATQRYEAALFAAAGGGTLRAQLGHRIVLGSMTSTTLGMSVENVEAAARPYAIAYGGALSNDPSADTARPTPGRGIVELSTSTRPVQCAYAPVEAWVEALEARGVRKPGGTPPVGPGGEPQVRYLPAEGEAVTVDAFDPTGETTGEVDLSSLVTGADPGLWD
ncbi:hypothetical protein AAEX63_01855 [Luteococcus sp. H138]|uniref:ATP-binding protein n=1 Tax=Luteococcus sp. H138 TaxID=3139404 RepID=UPI00313B7440